MEPNNNRIFNPNSGRSMDPSEIRKETYFDTLKYFVCPNFSKNSFTFQITILDIIIYFITILFGIKRSPTELLAPTFNTLDTFGMKYPIKIYNGQLHRLILFGLLHANLTHLISNMISQIILGNYLEQITGKKIMIILYILSNIGGGFFSCVLNNNPGVGASVAILGILGAYIGYMFMNWNYIDSVMDFGTKIFNLIFLAFMALFSMMAGGSESIDNYGHLGGFIYGFCLVFLFIDAKNESDGLWINNKVWKKGAMIGISVLSLFLVVDFWFINNPQNII